MKQSQTEIKAIQAKLQAIQAGRSAGRSPSLPAMVELTPNITPNSATATATKPVKRESEHLATAAEVLQQRAASYVKHYQQPIPEVNPRIDPRVNPQSSSQANPHTNSRINPQPPLQPLRELSERQFAEMLKRLEMQAQHINELSSAQEVAMLELKAMAEKAERGFKGSETENGGKGDRLSSSALCEYLEPAVPHIEKDEYGAFVLTTRSIDLFKAEREANRVADALRQRTPYPANPSATTRSRQKAGSRQRQHSGRSHNAVLGQLVRQVGAIFKWLTAPKVATGLRTSRSRQVEALEMPSFSIQNAAIWIIGSVVARVGLDLMLLAFPGMWLPVIGMIVTPAAIAVYRATVAPQTGIIWGYRLLLVMIGLLVGGRL